MQKGHVHWTDVTVHGAKASRRFRRDPGTCPQRVVIEFSNQTVGSGHRQFQQRDGSFSEALVRCMESRSRSYLVADSPGSQAKQSNTLASYAIVLLG